MYFEISQTRNWRKTILTENLTRKLNNWNIHYCYLKQAFNDSARFRKVQTNLVLNWKCGYVQLSTVHVYPEITFLAYLTCFHWYHTMNITFAVNTVTGTTLLTFLYTCFIARPGGRFQHLWGNGVSRGNRGHHLSGESSLWTWRGKYVCIREQTSL